MTRKVFATSILTVALLTGSARADGFPNARDGAADFQVHKNAANAVHIISKLPAETIKMTAKQFTGRLNINPAKLDTATGEFVVPFKNLELPKKMMKDHMLGSDWIDAEKNPDAKFTITGIEKPTAKKKTVEATLKGKMMIHGVEKEMSVPVVMAYSKDTRKDSQKDTLTIRAKFEIKLADFEIKGKAGTIGKGPKGVAETVQLTVNATMGIGDPDAAKPPAPPKMNKKATKFSR